MKTKKIIELKNVSFSYDNKTNVLDDICLNIFENDFLAIIGPNGGGKTTLVKLILNILKPRSGEVILKESNNFLGYVPQNTNLNLDFPIRVLEVVLMAHNFKRRKFFSYDKSDIACARKSLEQVGMLEYENYKIGSLSGGQRQRVFIARALCCTPKILFLDEPTASIDVEGQRVIYKLLNNLNINMAIVVISHDISLLLNYAKNVVHVNRQIVCHKIDKINQHSLSREGHLCEVEILNALGKKQEEKGRV